MQKIHNFIGGQFNAPQSNTYIDNYEPATGLVYSHIADSDEADVELAVSAAQQALPAWKSMSAEARCALMLKLADAIDDNAEALAKAESIDNGKPITLASNVDIPRASANIRFFAHAITQFASEAHPMGTEAINYTLRDPIGVVGCISPWNLPLYLFTWKIAPALATGNCVIAKPSEVTPMTAFLLAQLCEQVGFPKGGLNIIHGLGHKVGNAMVSHPKIKAISFTGGTATGAHIASVAAPMFKKLSLELGGKNPALVFADSYANEQEFDQLVDNLVRTSYANQGQICLCSSRIYVERAIYEKLKTALVERIQKLTHDDPLLPGTQQGAVVSKPHMEKVLSYITLAKQDGGTVLVGGQQKQLEGRCEQGYFIEPTLIEGLDINTRTNQEEIFGPVATIQPFDSDEEALSLANGTPYGLAATVWSQNVKRCTRLANELDFGIVWVNTWLTRDLRTPFGGMKQSGVGREGGLDALRFFTEPKNVCIKY